MAFVQGSAIDSAMKGSIENRQDIIHECVRNYYTDSKLNIMATFDTHVLAFNESKKLLKINYIFDEDNNCKVTGERFSRAIPVIEDADIPSHVSKQLKDIAGKMMSGKKVKRTQVRELADLTSKEEMYWLSDIVSKIEESTNNNDWYKMYEANLERIRTSLHGQIRLLEGQVPKTNYSKISASKLGEFNKEIKESLGIIKGLFGQFSQNCQELSFEDNQEFLNTVRESLIVEAQAVVGLLGKAAKLVRHDDLPMVANVHDKLADRARTMALVSAYIKGRSQMTDKE